MRKFFGILSIATITVLCSCSNNGSSSSSNTKGVIDCYSIKVTEGGSTVFSQNYSASWARVYEYKDSKGSSIYTSTRTQTYDSSYQMIDTPIRVYPDRYTSDFTEYTYDKFVGYLTVENNYYLNLDNNTIDSETKYSEYLYSANPSGETLTADNKKAFECAKTNYYIITSNYNNVIRIDMEEKGLERHTYTKLGNDSIITYKAKWF